MTVVTVGQVQKPLLDERVGLGRDIPNFPGALLVKIIVHGKPLFLSIPFFPAPAGMMSREQALQRNRPIITTFPSRSGRDVKMDNFTRRDQPDRSKINMGEDFEVKCWLKALGVSREELKRAVDKVGNSAATVRKELGV